MKNVFSSRFSPLVQLRELLLTSGENPTGCDSHMTTNNNHAVQQLLLNAISLKICSTRDTLRNLLERTLLALQAERLNVDLEKLLDDSLNYLIEMKIICEKEDTFETTKLGKATVEGERRSFFIWIDVLSGLQAASISVWPIIFTNI